MGKALTKDTNTSGYKSHIVYNQSIYTKEEFIEKQHQQLLDSRTFKNESSRLFNNQRFSDWSINDRIFEKWMPVISIFLLDLKRASIS